jgi:RNA 3'-phosphate cyclase
MLALIEVDGSEGEGGGQILRTAIALSALTGNDVVVRGIRAKRESPGLQAQHLCAVNGVARICDAKVDGGFVGSDSLQFSPGKVRGGRHHLNVGTAGSITLVLQACMLASARCKDESCFDVVGGTNVRWSPPIDFYGQVFFPQLERMGGRASIVEMKRGFYPEGGGRALALWRAPATYEPLRLIERGELGGIYGNVFIQGLPEHVGKRMGDAVRKALIGNRIQLRSESSQGVSRGAGVFLVARYSNCLLSADSLGERGLPSESVGDAAARALKDEMCSTSTLDVHCADQLLPYLCLAEEPSSFLVKEVTGHMEAQANLLRRFLGSTVEFTPSENGTKVDVRPSRTCS